MAKKKKYPKAPKAKSSLETWERHQDKIREVDAYNKKIDADKAKKAKIIETTRKMKAKR